MSLNQQIITIAILAFGTMLTRFLPFVLFSGKRETPVYIQYLGNVLPAAVFGMLVVYCLKDVQIGNPASLIPSFLGVSMTVLVHLYKKNMLLSILVGTLSYMLLLHLMA